MKTLVYIQDLGGAKFLLPALNSLKRDTFSLMVDSISARFVYSYSKHDFDTTSPSQTKKGDFWNNILEEYSSVISTTGTRLINPANCKLIEIAKNRNIPCLGFLDHWKGFERFYNDNLENIYLPDWLGVIDELTVTRLKKENIIPGTLRAVGHPWLDFLFLSNDGQGQAATKKILIISQPDYGNDFKSIFCQPHLSDQIATFVNAMQGKGYKSFYRPHPKERGNCFIDLPRDNMNYMDMLTGYDIFIGYDSMLLLEASVLGKQTIRIKSEETRKQSGHTIPLLFGKLLEDIDNIDNSFLSHSRDELRVNFPFKNSIERTLLFINEFRVHAHEK